MPCQIAENHTGRRSLGAAHHLFGRKGFDDTTTRELAAREGNNVASTTNHFGSKSGLRRECARTVAERVSSALDTPEMADAAAPPEAALVQVECPVGALLQLVVAKPQARDLVAFMLRELADPGDAAETLYSECGDIRHTALCDLRAKATGREADEDEVALAVFATLGQFHYFLITEPLVARRMTWDGIGRNETRKVAASLSTNLRNSIDRLRK